VIGDFEINYGHILEISYYSKSTIISMTQPTDMSISIGDDPVELPFQTLSRQRSAASVEHVQLVVDAFPQHSDVLNA